MNQKLKVNDGVPLIQYHMKLKKLKQVDLAKHFGTSSVNISVALRGLQYGMYPKLRADIINYINSIKN